MQDEFIYAKMRNADWQILQMLRNYNKFITSSIAIFLRLSEMPSSKTQVLEIIESRITAIAEVESQNHYS